MNKTSILLTGATGFLGSKILNSLSKEKYSIIILKRSTSSLKRIKHFTNNQILYTVVYILNNLLLFHFINLYYAYI